METTFTTATSLKKGSYILIDDAPCVVRSIDISKTGKHGASKARIEAIGLIDGQKRIIIKPGHENISVPIIEKRRAQVLNLISDKEVSVMDLESYETFNVDVDEDVKGQIQEGKQVEYWMIVGKKIIKRIL